MSVKSFIRNTGGDALVEAAILFPVMIMIFAALVLLAVYLPTRASLQRATQYAATAAATQCSDSWIFYDKETMAYHREQDKDKLKNVYVALFTGCKDAVKISEDIVIGMETSGISSKAGILVVYCYSVNLIVYQEIVVTAVRVFTVPVSLSFIHFPETISVIVTSTAVVQNGDEFVRDMDLAADFIKFLDEEYGLTGESGITESISSCWDKCVSFLGLR